MICCIFFVEADTLEMMNPPPPGREFCTGAACCHPSACKYANPAGEDSKCLCDCCWKGSCQNPLEHYITEILKIVSPYRTQADECNRYIYNKIWERLLKNAGCSPHHTNEEKARIIANLLSRIQTSKFAREELKGYLMGSTTKRELNPNAAVFVPRGQHNTSQ